VFTERENMGKTTRKRYTREFKLSLIRELESGKKLGQLSRENNIHPNMISRWKLEYDKDGYKSPVDFEKTLSLNIEP
jgi:transposase